MIFFNFKIIAEERKPIVKLLDDLKATQRASAKALGVGVGTINSDVNDDVQNRTKKEVEEIIDIDNQDVTNEDVQNRTPEEIPEELPPTTPEVSTQDLFKTNVKNVEKEFKTNYDVKKWMIANQMDRRNLTDIQRSELRAERYLLEKKKPHRPKKGAHCAPLKTSQKVADEFNVTDRLIIKYAF